MRSSYHSSNLPAERQPDARYARNHESRQEQAREGGPEIGDEQVDAALLARTSVPHGTDIVETGWSLSDRAVSTSLPESAAWATERNCEGVGWIANGLVARQETIRAWAICPGLGASPSERCSQ